MGRTRAWIAACVLCAPAAFGQIAAAEIIFADGFEFRPYISPLWLPGVCDAPAVDAGFESGGDVLFNTDVGASCTGGVVTQTDGPDICVVRAKTVRVGGSLTVTGTRALALVADNSLLVEGVIDVAATGELSGPGGGFRTSGGASTSTSGGGGAGFATAGGAGGGAGGTGTGGVGGTAVNPLDLPAFQGGPKAAPRPTSIRTAAAAAARSC
jgi:hypothetical protein